MSWPFWSFRTSPPAVPTPALPLDCESIEPLLPLYADSMASPDEARQVEAHLPGCEGCRESLFWMQATHRALASRPVAVPPANLHLRIAEAIATSSAAPSLRPARSFTLRSAYAAAASLTVVGAILWHSLSPSPAPPVPVLGNVKHAPIMVASVPPAALKVRQALPHPARVNPHQTLTAHNVPSRTSKTAIHTFTPKKTAPENVTAPPDRVADSTPAHTFVPPLIPVKPAAHHPAASPDKMASAKVPPAEQRHPAIPDVIALRIASVPPARHDTVSPPVAVVVAPSTVITQPAAQTASAAAASGSLLAAVNARARAMSTVAYGKTSLMERQISRGGTDAIHELDHEHTGYQPAVYTP